MVKIHFSDFFEISPEILEEYGAFNVSLVSALPLFIDPFLLFNSDDPVDQQLHDEVIRYVRFLRDRSATGSLDPGLLNAWYRFSDVKQTWLDYSKNGNCGSGLGRDFARALHDNLFSVFADFGGERITRGSHLVLLPHICGDGRMNEHRLLACKPPLPGQYALVRYRSS
jgi:hypothetical protein